MDRPPRGAAEAVLEAQGPDLEGASCALAAATCSAHSSGLPRAASWLPEQPLNVLFLSISAPFFSFSFRVSSSFAYSANSFKSLKRKTTDSFLAYCQPSVFVPQYLENPAGSFMESLLMWFPAGWAHFL